MCVRIVPEPVLEAVADLLLSIGAEMTQLDLFEDGGPPHFDGPDITDADCIRLGTALHKVRELMSDGNWRTLAEIATAAQCSQAGASARIRDLRKQRFGGHVVERKRLTEGTWVYRVIR